MSCILGERTLRGSVWTRRLLQQFLQLLCPEFVIPKDRQGAESDVKAKETLFELARAQSPTSTNAAVRYQGERASFKRTKVLLGPRGSW